MSKFEVGSKVIYTAKDYDSNHDSPGRYNKPGTIVFLYKTGAADIRFDEDGRELHAFSTQFIAAPTAIDGRDQQIAELKARLEAAEAELKMLRPCVPVYEHSFYGFDREQMDLIEQVVVGLGFEVDIVSRRRDHEFKVYKKEQTK